MKKIALVLCMLLLAACGKSLDGTYMLGSGFGSSGLIFKSGGKVVQTTSMMGMESEQEMSYKIDGDKIKISAGQGASMVLTLLPDGSIQGPMGMKYVKQK